MEIDAHLDEFNSLRIARNQSEYEALFVQPDEVAEALHHAKAIVEAVARALSD